MKKKKWAKRIRKQISLLRLDETIIFDRIPVAGIVELCKIIERDLDFVCLSKKQIVNRALMTSIHNKHVILTLPKKS